MILVKQGYEIFLVFGFNYNRFENNISQIQLINVCFIWCAIIGITDLDDTSENVTWSRVVFEPVDVI